jgi:hypothetical protein
MPPVNWFGGMLIARYLLAWRAGNDRRTVPESYLDQINRMNWLHRVQVTRCIRDRAERDRRRFAPESEPATRDDYRGRGDPETM